MGCGVMRAGAQTKKGGLRQHAVLRLASENGRCPPREAGRRRGNTSARPPFPRPSSGPAAEGQEQERRRQTSRPHAPAVTSGAASPLPAPRGEGQICWARRKLQSGLPGVLVRPHG